MNNLIEALLKAQKQINHAVQDSKSHFGNYASLEAVIEAGKKPLNDNGIYFQQKTSISERGCIVETVFYGHGAELSAGQIFIAASKNNAQQFGSSLSYARRYQLLVALGIASNDDDGQASTDASNSTQSEPVPANHIEEQLSDLKNAKSWDEALEIHQRHMDVAKLAHDKNTQSELIVAYTNWVTQEQAKRLNND
jgi:hypothetical protein